MAPVADRHEVWGEGGVYPKSKILFSFGYLLVSFVYSKAFHLWLRIIFHLSLYLYPKVVFKYMGRSIRFREQRSRRNQPSPSDDRGICQLEFPSQRRVWWGNGNAARLCLNVAVWLLFILIVSVVHM